MNLFLVADVGNSRIKWGRCDAERVVDAASLPLDDPAAWLDQFQAWQLTASLSWFVSGVNPQGITRLIDWLQARSATVHQFDKYHQLPIRVGVEHPEQVGMDRLFNAVAANSRHRRGKPAIVIDAGSAVTVDWIDSEGIFRGGAIFPGLRLMAQALHQYTAKLPLVEITGSSPPMPGMSTRPAIAAGVYGAVVGGIRYLARQLAAEATISPVTFLTGGDAAVLAPALKPGVEVWPWMTLEGIRLSADSRLASR